MRKKKQKQVKQLTNYLKFVVAGILLVIIVALVSGCGSQVQDDGSSSGQKKVLSKTEIQELTDLVVTDSEDSFCEVEYGEDFIEGVITDEFDWNSHYIYVWGWKDRGEDGDEIGSDPQILAQVSEDQKVLQTFSEDELALYHGKWASTEFVGATDQELFFCAKSGITINEKWIWYRIPLSYENGQEKVLYEKKEAIYEAEEEWGSVYCGAGKYLLCGYDGEIFVLDKESGETQRVVKNSKDKSYGYIGFDPWISPEGDTYVVLVGYQDHLDNSLYAYRLGTKEVQEITTEISSESRVTYGDGKVFFTGLVDHQMQNDYNLYVYDMLTGQKKILASEAEIREILPKKPSEHADFIREMAYAQGTLYLEIRYAKQCYVVSCAVEKGSLALLEGLPELVRHREYQVSEPIKNGNSRYYNVNDHNIFENSEGGVVERTLDGKYVRTIHLLYPYSLIYANNEELIFECETEPCDGSIIYSVPLVQLDGNDYPDINRRKILLKKVHPEYDGDGVRSAAFYADEKYLIYISNDHSFVAYDRQAQKFVDIAGIPQERQGLVTDNILNNKSGEYIVFEAHSKNREKKGFLLYHFGDSKVTPLDHYGYDAHWSEDGKILIYEGWSGRDEDLIKIYSYHVDTGKKKVIFTKKDLKEIFKQVSENQEIMPYYDSFSVSGKIYYVARALKGNKCWVVSYDLAGGGELQYEAQISDFVNVNQDLELWDLEVAEGTLFIMKAQMDEEGDVDESSAKYYYYNPGTGKYAEIGETDEERLYLSLVNLD